MCLAIPVLITSVNETDAEVEIGGVSRGISTYLTPEARVGDYVLLHAGFAIRIIDQDEARGTIELFRQLDETNR